MKKILPPPRVLLIDDDDAFRQVMTSELSRRKYLVSSAANGGTALEGKTASQADVILLDLHLPDMDGIEVLKRLRKKEIPGGVVVLTGHGTIDTAIQAIRLGAYDYLEKPCPIEKVEMAIQKTCEHLGLLARQRVLQDGYSPPDLRHGLIGASPAFRKMCRTVKRIAQTDATTLILGETGVGKDMVATLLHTQSSRKDAPYVVVDCAALHEDLLQSELFGHEKGAFSGAARRKHGLFEVAHEGTLFLDEVGDTSQDIQAKLLRVLETGRFRRLGGTEEIAVNVRVVSATNRNLMDAMEKGRFRKDLYFRLSTMTVEIPPLRKRPEDVPLLLDHFIDRFNRRFSRSSRLGEDARQALLHYDWPGNVRELIHVLEQAIVLSDERVGIGDLPERIRVHSSGKTCRESLNGLPSLQEVERRHTQAVLEAVGGRRAEAARILGISERNLYRLIKKHGEQAG
ncbi:MAG: sigma-54-dependent transcriptional regulator [Planctomycetota bacterium]